MFDNLKIGYLAWRLLSDLKGGTMDVTLILQLAQLLIPIIVPLEIAAVKKLAPMLPSWLLPILAPILGGFQAGITGISTVGAGAVLRGLCR